MCYLSPPSPALDQERVALTVPAPWHVLGRQSLAGMHMPENKDMAGSWGRLGTELDISRGKQSLSVIIYVKGRSWAERHGDLDGAPYRVSPELSGIYHAEQQGDESSWYLAVPRQKGGAVIIVRALGRRADRRVLEPVVRRLYRSLRLVT